MRTIEIFDTTNRDGEQACKRFREGGESKLVIARKLVDLGVNTIEAGFPASSEADYEAVKKIAAEIQGPYICALARTFPLDIERAADAIRGSKKPTLHVFSYMANDDSIESYAAGEQISVDAFKEKVAATAGKGVIRARKANPKGRVEFSLQNAARAVYEAVLRKDEENLDYLFGIYQAAVINGADVLNIPDTEGFMHPSEIAGVVKMFRQRFTNHPDVLLSIHCHNDLGLATANSLAAIQAGIDQVECTINGIGERAGNASLEEVVMNLHTRSYAMQADTSINTPILGPISRLVSYHSGILVQPNKAIVGENALNHSSGVHQNGKDKGDKAGKLVYQLFLAEDVGWIGSSRITARSGSSEIGEWYARLGFIFDGTLLKEKIMPMVKALGDERDELSDVDLRHVADAVNGYQPVMCYRDHSVMKRKGSPDYEGAVDMEIDGEIRRGTTHSADGIRVRGVMNSHTGMSHGAVDALFRSIDEVSGIQDIPVLVSFNVVNIRKGHDAVGEVTVILSSNGYDSNVGKGKPVFIGRARNKDTLTAAQMAYIEALDKYRQNST